MQAKPYWQDGMMAYTGMAIAWKGKHNNIMENKAHYSHLALNLDGFIQ